MFLRILFAALWDNVPLMQGKNKEATLRPAIWQSMTFTMSARGMSGDRLGTKLLRQWKEKEKLLACGG